MDGDGFNGDGDAGPPRGAGPTAPDTPDDGTPPPGRRDEPPRDEKRRPHAATKDDVVTPSGGAARPGATVYAGDEVSPGDLLGPEDMWWPEGARPSDNPRPPADSGTGPDDTHRPRAETSSPGDAPPPGEDGTHRPRGAAADETFIPDEDPADVQTMYGTAAAVRRAAAQQCRQRRHARPRRHGALRLRTPLVASLVAQGHDLRHPFGAPRNPRSSALPHFIGCRRIVFHFSGWACRTSDK